MSFWDVLDSRLVSTILSVILGGVIASLITGSWQRRSQKYSFRLNLAQEMISIFYQYTRFLKRDETTGEKREFDKLHADFLTNTTMARALYSKSIADQLNNLAQQLASIQAHRDEGQMETAQVSRKKLLSEAETIFEKIIREIDTKMY